MYGTRSASGGSTSRAPVNGGAGRSSKREPWRGSRAPRRAAAAAAAPSRRADSRSRSWSSRFSASSAARRFGSSRPRRRRRRGSRRARAPSRAVLRRDLDRGVLARRRRSADQQRQLEPRALHLARDVDHLVERRRDQPREADDVDLLALGGVEDRLGRHHHAEVDHLVVVAAEHDADDVLADVVHVALDGREQHLALALRRAVLLLLHVRLEVGDRALHHPRRLDDLRQEHPARAEEVADDAHPVHQRALDHVERPRRRQARLLGVLLDEVDDPVHERVLEPLLDRRLAPRQVELALRAPAR